MGDCRVSISSCSSSLASCLSSPNTNPLSIDVEIWLMAEERIQEILWTLQPNAASEWRRLGLIGYVQRLIKVRTGTEVLSFGSVPLKAYLPDGDIDLTALCHRGTEEDLARALCDALESEPKDSWVQIRDVHYVRAQVKVVKCTVNNISVDISFNQTAGLCTLCFLEQVDRLIGRDHLFKKSIILIKAWCYYESRILGAHHGLISTYALETLVLLIINLFHSSLSGPLEVLHRFLEYYSTFDWDNYCISINGPVAISSLPDIIVTPQNEGKELLLSEGFLKECKEVFSDPTRAHEATVQFQTKHLNIVDPLKDNNNLGRSVSKGNFYRIKHALSFGARKLREILMLPSERIGQRLESFFTTTIDRNGRGQRPDVQTPVPAFGSGRSENSNLSADLATLFNCLLYGQAYHLSTHLSAAASEAGNETTGNLLNPSVAQLNSNIFCERAANMYSRLLLWDSSASSSATAALGIGEMRKSQGTGPYIPDVNSNYARYVHPMGKGKNSEHRPHSPIVESRRQSDQVEASERTSENASRFNPSPEDFPPLPGSRPPPEVHQSVQSLASPPAKESSRTYRSFKWESFGHSPAPSATSSPASSKQADTRISCTPDMISEVPETEMQKQQESSEVEDARIQMEQFILDNDKDFPPLGL